MLQFMIAIFMILHGFVHLLYLGQSARFFELKPGMVWPDEAWTFARLWGNVATRNLASILLVVTAIGFGVGGMGILLHQTWSRPIVMAAAVVSILVFVLFWDGKLRELADKGGIGILISAGIIVALFIVRLPDLEF